jgi:hypothetical protein
MGPDGKVVAAGPAQAATTNTTSEWRATSAADAPTPFPRLDFAGG